MAKRRSVFYILRTNTTIGEVCKKRVTAQYVKSKRNLCYLGVIHPDTILSLYGWLMQPYINKCQCKSRKKILFKEKQTEKIAPEFCIYLHHLQHVRKKIKTFPSVLQNYVVKYHKSYWEAMERSQYIHEPRSTIIKYHCTETISFGVSLT